MFIIFTEICALLMIIATYCFISFIDFKKTGAKLTPIFYISADSIYYFYFAVMIKDRQDCEAYIAS